MKKEFKLTDSVKAPARQVEAVKHDIRKYLARERRKTPAKGADYWDFDCKLGQDEESALDIHIGDINKGIDKVVTEGLDHIYVEILAKPGYKAKKP